MEIHTFILCLKINQDKPLLEKIGLVFCDNIIQLCQSDKRPKKKNNWKETSTIGK